MSSVTYALREQIGLREDLEMQLRSTQEDLAKAGMFTQVLLLKSVLAKDLQLQTLAINQ